MPSVAAITVAVVHEMPFVREAAGCTGLPGPVSPSFISARTRSRSSAPVSSSPRKVKVSSRCRVEKCTELVRELVVVLQRVDERGGVDPEIAAQVQRQPQELGVAGDAGRGGRPGRVTKS